MPTSSTIDLERILFSVKAYLSYWLHKEDRYSQHSPFVFDLYSRLVTFLSNHQEGDREIENFRTSLLKNHSKVEVLDLGAGSKKVPFSHREVAKITRYSTSNAKYSQLYQFFCENTPGELVIELGTCVGISTRYLSKGTRGTLYSIEGSGELQKIAQKNPCPTAINFILGPIDDTLPKLLQKLPKVDFALLDANHTYRSTLDYFFLLLPKIQSSSILAIGDIHWSPEMERAWDEIISNPAVTLSIDFFECGLVFFNPDLAKSHLILDI